MKFAGADDAVRAYCRLGLSLASPRAQTIGERTRIPVSACVRCGHGKSQISVSRTKGERRTCVSCGSAWRLITVIEGVGAARRATPPRSSGLDAYAEIGRCLSRVSLWPRRALVLYATWSEPGRRAEGVARCCASRWPRRLGGWSPRVVRDLVAAGRARLETELERAELLDTDGCALRRAMGGR